MKPPSRPFLFPTLHEEPHSIAGGQQHCYDPGCQGERGKLFGRAAYRLSSFVGRESLLSRLLAAPNALLVDALRSGMIMPLCMEAARISTNPSSTIAAGSAGAQ